MKIQRNSIVFLAAMFAVALFSGQAFVLINMGIGLGLIYVAVMLVCKTMRNIDKNLNEGGTKRAFDWSMVYEPMSVEKLSPDLQKAETTILNLIRSHGDNLSDINQRFAYLIGMSQDQNTPLPKHLDNMITKKLLFDYQRRYGNLRNGILSSNRLTPEEVMTPISPQDRTAFEQFCVKQSI